MRKAVDSYYSQARPEIASIVPNDIKTILDIGCGEGRFLQLIKEKTGAESWGIEQEDQIAKQAKFNADNILTGRVEDCFSGLPDAYFDCIVFNDVLEHLNDPAGILRSMTRYLSKNGMIIASIPNVRYFYNLIELLVQKDWKYKESGVLDSTHLRFFTKKSILRLFIETGYEVKLIKGINAVHSWKFRLFNIVTAGIFNDTKYLQFLCVGRPKH
jgi:2-polyprenyl-3-methyl-5-hydroxy-6-metoxy-1,4-benzoquinol methylase